MFGNVSMYRSKAVLILGKNENSKLVKLLFEVGCIPILAHSIHRTIDKLHKNKFYAIFLDGDYEEVDTLEFVLSVRGIDKHIPIFIIGLLQENGEKILPPSETEESKVYFFPTITPNIKIDLTSIMKRGAL